MSKLHVERGLISDKYFGGTYSAIVDEWGNEVAVTPDDNEYLDKMAAGPDLHETLAVMTKDYRDIRRAFYKFRESDGDCPLIQQALKILNAH